MKTLATNITFILFDKAKTQQNIQFINIEKLIIFFIDNFLKKNETNKVIDDIPKLTKEAFYIFEFK